MSRSTRSAGSQSAEPRAISIDRIMSAKTGDVSELAKELKLTFPTTVSTLEQKKLFLIKEGHAMCMLHESQCAKVVQEHPQLQDELQAVKMAVHEAQRAAAEAASDAQAAKAAASAAQEDTATLRRQVADLSNKVQNLLLQSEEVADAAAQQALADQAIWFGHTLDDGELRQGGSALRESVCAELLEAGVSQDVVAGVLEVSVLPARGGDRRPPVVLQCASVPAKAALLRAAREAGSPERGLQMAARLTRWQQARKKALLPKLRELKGQGEVVRFARGHVLQKKVDGGWVDVPLVIAA